MALTFHRLVPLLILAIAAHNFEEWLTFPYYGELSAVLGKRLGFETSPKPWPIVQGGLVFVTVVPTVLLIFARQTSKAWGAWVICWIASIFLANVFIPHIPAMVLIYGYAPGGITALFVNLPLTILVLLKAKREQLLTRRQVRVAMVTGVMSLPLSIGVAFAIGRVILS